MHVVIIIIEYKYSVVSNSIRILNGIVKSYLHISCVHIHTSARLQNKIVYVPVKNKIKKTNLH